MSRSNENWDFVLNNYDDDLLSQLYIVLSNKSFFKKAVGYKEIGSVNKTPHIQGYFRYFKKTTKNEILQSSGINDGILKDKVSIRIVRNINAVKNYVKKDGNLWLNTDKEADFSILNKWECERKHTDKVEHFLKVVDMVKNGYSYKILYDDYFDNIKKCRICYDKIKDYEIL